LIHGIGTDIVRIARVAANLERFGERFARRILADSEFAEFTAAARPERLLAKRFCAKEAAAKALGTGFRNGLALRHIAVVHDALGRPGLAFEGRGRELVAELGVGVAHLSIADEDDYAVAYVVLMGR